MIFVKVFTFHDFGVLCQPLFLNQFKHILRVLSPNRPYQELNTNITNNNKSAKKTFPFTQNCPTCSLKILQVFGGQSLSLAPTLQLMATKASILDPTHKTYWELQNQVDIARFLSCVANAEWRLENFV